MADKMVVKSESCWCRNMVRVLSWLQKSRESCFFFAFFTHISTKSVKDLKSKCECSLGRATILLKLLFILVVITSYSTVM